MKHCSHKIVFGTANDSYTKRVYSPKKTASLQIKTNNFDCILNNKLTESYHEGIRHYDTAIWYGTQSVLDKLLGDKPDIAFFTKLIFPSKWKLTEDGIFWSKLYDRHNESLLRKEFNDQYKLISTIADDDELIRKSIYLFKLSFKKYLNHSKFKAIFIHDCDYDHINTVELKQLLLKMSTELKTLTHSIGLSNSIERVDLEEIIKYCLEEIGLSTIYLQEDSELLIAKDMEKYIAIIKCLKNKYKERLQIMAYSGSFIKKHCQNTPSEYDYIDYIIFKTHSNKSKRYIKDWVSNFLV